MTATAPPNGFRTFIILWLTQSLSGFGTQITVFALNIWLATVLFPAAEQRAELASAIAIMSIAIAIPSVFGAPLAGAWADHNNRKRTMMLTDALHGILTIIELLLIYTQNFQVWTLGVTVFLHGLFHTFHSAAFDTSYSSIVPKAQLARANGMMQTTQSLSGILAPGAAAFIVSLPSLARQGLIGGDVGDWLASLPNGVILALSIDALSFFIAAIVPYFLSVPSPVPSPNSTPQATQPAKPGLWHDVKIGAVYIWQRRPLLWLLAIFTIANFTGWPVFMLMPLLLKFNLAADWAANGYTFETATALMSTLGSLGGLTGGLLISTWGGLKTRRIYGVVLAMLGTGIAIMAIGMSSWFYLAVAANFLYAGLIPIGNAHSQAIWQGQTPPELQGRVFAVRRVIAQFTWPLSTVIAGYAGGVFDLSLYITAMGVICVVFCTGRLFNPVLRRVEDKAYLDSLAAQAVAKSA
ncbi:MAG: MFS transporter [Anaerolineae bacterium]|nr:MFS transporter [Anaerolineae bacterium]